MCELIAFFSSRQHKHWVKVYADAGPDGQVLWFETDEPGSWGSIDHSMNDEQLLDWLQKFAARWGQRYHVKLKEREIA